VWQALREELHPNGLEIVTVALDVHPDEARPFIEAAAPTHPSLIDRGHLVDERFGIVNVPNGVWIDEQGTIVRPAEPASPGRNAMMDSLHALDLSTMPEDVAAMLVEARKIQLDHELYVEMLRDWVEHGAASRYALSPDEVVRRSHPRGDAEARAAAHFELGEHLHRDADHDGAIEHWREAHRLHPDNWTYKRQAWNIEDPMRQGRTDKYDGSWYDDVVAIGAEHYYPKLTP
jgi:hypothetical protein